MADSQEPYQVQEDNLDIKKLLNKIFRRWYWFVLSICITYSIAWFINRYTVPQYDINASLLVNEEKKSMGELLVSVFDRYGPRKNIDNEIAILKSYSMAAKALQNLDFGVSYYIVGRIRETELYPKKPFLVVPDSTTIYGKQVDITFLPGKKCQISIGEDIRETINVGEKFEKYGFAFTIYPSEFANIEDLEGRKYFFIIHNFNSLVNRYRRKLSVVANDKRGTVLTLSLSGAVPQKEADYVNTLMDAYIQNGLDEKNQMSINAIQFINEQLGFVTDSLKRAEDILENFRTSNKMFDFTLEGHAILERLNILISEQQKVNTQLNYYRYLRNYLEKEDELGRIVAPSIMGVDDLLLNSLVNELVKLSIKKSDLSNSSDPEKNPIVRNLDAQISSIQASLRENVNQLVESTDVALKDVNKRRSDVEKDLLKLPVTERRLLEIQREYNLNNETYNFLLKKHAEAAIAKASNVADNRVLDYAIVQNASKIAPKASRNILIAIALGLLIPLILVFIIDFFNHKISDLDEVRKITSLPIIGIIGHNNKASEIPVAENPTSPLSESFRALRTNLHYLLRNKDEKIIAVSSTVSGEGKTFISTNLASIIAHSGKKVLLMGLDLRKPKINKVFNINNHEGISTYLIGDSKYEDIIHATNIANLYIAPSGPIPPNPAELIETPKMGELLNKACTEFDFIVIDTPPVAVVVDSILLAQYTNLNIFVIRYNLSSKDSLLLANDLQKQEQIKSLSLVINDVSAGSSYGLGRYRYNYGYGYSYSGYGNYYNSYMEEEKTSFWNRLLFWKNRKNKQ
ncbi:MAG: polysaccharide biosynthesis tyrosine autokinase [Bacteroidales bacterium]|jgi:capsular exopolysaccharide synthesis family protein|nr:polysaccharide biosynthesis tyrosine autokinase [Bacteroidales bacterium]